MRIHVTDTRSETTRQHEYHDVAVSVGSDSGNLLQLPSMDVPAYAAMIMPRHGGGIEAWTYVPVDPAGSATVGGEPMSGPHELEDGDEVCMDRFTLRIELDVADELELPESSNLHELQKIKQYPLPPRSETQRAEEDVRLTPRQLTALCAFGVRLGRTTDFVRLLEETLTLLHHEIKARRVWMGIQRHEAGRLEFVDGRTAEGKHSGDPPMIDALVYRCLSRRQYLTIPRPADASLRSMMAVPIIGPRGPLGLIYADSARGEHRLAAAEMDFMTVLASMVGAQVEAISGGLEAQQDRIAEGQVAFLRAIQDRLDPTNVPTWPQLQVAAYARPGTRRAGDIYDITRLPNGLAGIMLGHVRAEPTRAAVVMTQVRSAFRIASLHADPPHIQLQALNWLLYDAKDPCTMDALIAVINPKTGAMEYGMAGRIGAVVVARRGDPRPLQMPASEPIAARRSAVYARATDRIRSGESFAIYSPGCEAAADASGEPLGPERFVNAVCDGFGQPAATALDGMLVDLSAFLKDGTAQDDITILYLHRVASAT